MPVASDTARAIGILGSLLWATGIARARQCRLEIILYHRLDELAHPIAQADFDRIKPIVEKMDRRLGLRLQGCRVRAIAGHGVVSTGALTPGLLRFQNPETTTPSIPTTPRTAPVIKQALASGVYGLVLPHLSTVEDAQAAVVAARYPQVSGVQDFAPAGERGWGNRIASRYWGLTPQEYYDAA